MSLICFYNSDKQLFPLHAWTTLSCYVCRMLCALPLCRYTVCSFKELKHILIIYLFLFVFFQMWKGPLLTLVATVGMTRPLQLQISPIIQPQWAIMGLLRFGKPERGGFLISFKHFKLYFFVVLEEKKTFGFATACLLNLPISNKG